MIDEKAGSAERERDGADYVGRVVLAIATTTAVFVLASGYAAGKDDLSTVANTGAFYAGALTLIAHVLYRVIGSLTDRGAALAIVLSVTAVLAGVGSAVVAVVLAFVAGPVASVATVGGVSGGLFFGGFLSFIVSLRTYATEKDR